MNIAKSKTCLLFPEEVCTVQHRDFTTHICMKKTKLVDLFIVFDVSGDLEPIPWVGVRPNAAPLTSNIW
jgi:hypothetical protein